MIRLWKSLVLMHAVMVLDVRSEYCLMLWLPFYKSASAVACLSGDKLLCMFQTAVHFSFKLKLIEFISFPALYFCLACDFG